MKARKNFKTNQIPKKMKKTNLLSKAEMKNVLGGKKQMMCGVCDGNLVPFDCMGNMGTTDANGIFVGGQWSPTNGGCSGPVMYTCAGEVVMQPCA